MTAIRPSWYIRKVCILDMDRKGKTYRSNLPVQASTRYTLLVVIALRAATVASPLRPMGIERFEPESEDATAALRGGCPCLIPQRLAKKCSNWDELIGATNLRKLDLSLRIVWI